MHPAADNILLLEHRNKAIASLYNSKDFNDCINKMEPAHLRDDLKSEVMLVLMEKDPALVVGLEQRGELKWYVVRVILNMACSNRSMFTKQYRQQTTNIIPEYPVKELNGRMVKEMKQDAVMRYISTELYWYDRTICELYMKHGNFRAIEKETRIPWMSCYKTVRKVITKIREDVLAATE